MTPLLEVKALKKEFTVRSEFLRPSLKMTAVNEVNLSIYSGETLGLVGESGCGKSTLGKLILQLIEKSSGEIFYHGKPLRLFKKNELKDFRKKTQMIFQDPFGSLNPRMTVFDTLIEPLIIHSLRKTYQDKKNRVLELLKLVGLSDSHGDRFPHELSGGQRQRVAIARAIAVEPELIVCDEAVSALDVSIQAQVINLLFALQKTFGLTYLFISHDLRVVKHLSNRVAVMYLGKIVEIADTNTLYRNPKHPYTKALLSAVLSHRKKNQERIILTGEPPSPTNPPQGCTFHPRCPLKEDRCEKEIPKLRNIEDSLVSCLVV